MKKFLWIIVLLSFRCMAQDLTIALSSEEITDQRYRPGKIEHIVLFKYRPDVNNETKQLVIDRFLDLKNQCVRNNLAYIGSIVTGSANSLEGLDRGFDQGFIVTFRSEGDRNFYVGNPIVNDHRYYDLKHDEFKNFVRPLLLNGPEGVLVFDFRVQDN